MSLWKYGRGVCLNFVLNLGRAVMKHLKCDGKHMAAKHLAVLQYFSVGDTSNTVTREWSISTFWLLLFFDVHGMISQHWVPHGQTVNTEYYANVLKTHLRGAMRKKRPDLLKKQWFLLQDNARPHISAVALAALTETGGTALKYFPYSTDLAPCDFWAFPTLKGQLHGKTFSSDDEVRNATAAVLKGMSQNNLFHVFESSIKRCKKCIQREWCYFEK